jgi:chaperonin GroES
MNIKQLEDRVLIKIEKVEKKSEGGIFLPGASSDSNPVQGKIVAVGAGRKNEDGNVIPVSVAVDSVVLLYKHAGTPIKIDGEEYVIASESELLAVVE